MTGKTDLFCAAIADALKDKSFVKVSLGHYRGPEDSLKNLIARRIVVKREEKLSFTYRHKTRDIVKNHAIEDGLRLIRSALQEGFQAGTLFTTAFDLSYETMKKNPPTHKEAPSASHDRAKNRVIATDGKAYLHALGITDAKGGVIKAAQDKYRQINKYVELLSPLLRDLPTTTPKIADMGSGKGYLTFALYDYLRNSLAMQPQVTGVEYRADLVSLCNKIAKESGFDRLDFVQGAIDGYDCAGTDALIALHACDTATDDAIAKGIHAGAALIVVAPCCHKQVRREMEKGTAHQSLAPLLSHGIFVEREAEMATDTIRALILEYSGYTVKVFEFISDAHTPKNVMITAVKSGKGKNPVFLDKIRDTKALFGIQQHYLEKLVAI